jgi:hypothetical protein
MFSAKKEQNNSERWDNPMDIHSDNYKVAALGQQEDAVEVTLIAYEKSEGPRSTEQ